MRDRADRLSTSSRCTLRHGIKLAAERAQAVQSPLDGRDLFHEILQHAVRVFFPVLQVSNSLHRPVALVVPVLDYILQRCEVLSAGFETAYSGFQLSEFGMCSPEVERHVDAVCLEVSLCCLFAANDDDLDESLLSHRLL